MPAFLDWFLALLPILVILVLMLWRHWGSAQAGFAGWLTALALAALWFGAGPAVLFYAQVRGLLLSLYVLYIIWAALIFFRVTDEAGAVAAVGLGLPRLTPDRGLQVLLLGWAFASFLQGVGGFGVPVAVVAPLLVELGFAPVTAVVIPTVGHAWAVSFGSLGASFYALMAATGRSGDELAPWSAVLLGLACLGCGAGALSAAGRSVWAAGGRRTVWTNLLPLLLMGLTMAGVQFLTVTHGLWAIGAMMGALAGLAVGVAWARWSGRRVQETKGEGGVAWAVVPYALLVGMVLAAELVPPVRDLLGQVVLRVQLPEVVTARGWVTPAGAGRSISVFGHAGALLIYASLVTYGLFWWRRRYAPGAARRIVTKVVHSALKSSLGILAMVGMAATMEDAGMTHLLADGLARAAGPIFPLLSPFIGALGAFMTGSNTNSNVVLGALQEQIAVLLGLSPLVILAAQTAGGAIGSLFAPAKIIVGCSTVNLGGREGPVMRQAMVYGLLIIAGLALFTGAVVVLAPGPGFQP
ncbi:MAG: L-lactate permease [Chloroflexi bacterium]|nr:L-lactate permease [Chloroflexota bacterium]MBU1752133.1 L-lactate permease [Chloroflexota bacterium]